MDRRSFLIGAGSLAAVPLFGGVKGATAKVVVKFGMMTDIHYADIAARTENLPPESAERPWDWMNYRAGLDKLRFAVGVFNERREDFVIELGDFKDDCGHDKTLEYLERLEKAYAEFKGPRYHVLGNHDADCICKAEFLSRIENSGIEKGRDYYAFEQKGVKFIVLNACFDSRGRAYDKSNPWDDANIPPEELKWLEGELAATKGKVVVFCHQRLDTKAFPKHDVRNAAAVRKVMEASGKVVAVFTGHEHLGGHDEVNGIVYYSLRSLGIRSQWDNCSFAEVSVFDDGSVEVKGFDRAADFPDKRAMTTAMAGVTPFAYGFDPGWGGAAKLTMKCPGITKPFRVRFLADNHLNLRDSRDDDHIENCKRMSGEWRKDKTVRQVFEEQLAEMKNSKPDLVILLGDTFNFPTLANTEYVKKSLDALGIPWLYIAGNHDWHFEKQPGRDLDMRREWIEKRMKPLYQGENPMCYSRVVNGVRFVMIDDSVYQIDAEQLAFYRREAAKPEPICLCMHIPLWAPGFDNLYVGHPEWGAKTDKYWQYEGREMWPDHASPETAEFREAVLNTKNLAGVFTGHIHRWMFSSDRGRNLFGVTAAFQGDTLETCFVR